MPLDKQSELLRLFKKDRAYMHRHLFAHRHKNDDPAFHKDMLELLYSTHPQVALMAFRGAAKSTYTEELIITQALFKEANFVLVVGAKEENAAERLEPIKHEIAFNDAILELFGDQVASPWSQTTLGLANGVKIQAVGVGQTMRGKKHNDERPDLAVIDDLEDEESIRTKEARARAERWLTGTLIPALHPTEGRIRFVGTPLHPEALIVKKCNDPSWKSRIFPIVNLDTKTGEETSAWPSRFPMSWVRKRREEYLAGGNFVEWEQEYMCRAEDVAGKPFQPGMLKVKEVPVQSLPAFMFVDPARTTKDKSARTGYALWSWIGNKLIVRQAEGRFHKPDEIVSTIMEWDIKYEPVLVGVEAVGLEEFLLQPLRAAALRLGRSIPFVDIRAPRDKISFIKGLQPFYMAGDVTHVQHFPDLESELLQFPTGRMDVPNALAYALRMRAGKPVYEDFTPDHILAAMEPHRGYPRFLCVSSRAAMTAGALCQYIDGSIRIFAAWAYNEPPQECFERMVREAILVGGQLKVTAPAEQFDQYTNYGLPAAIQRVVGGNCLHTSTAATAEGQLREWLRKQIKGEPALRVCNDARWVRNALAGGYARRLGKGGVLNDYPTDDQYRLVMEAIESWVKYFDRQYLSGDGIENLRYDTTPDGRRFISLRK